jgi:uncharacterized protein (DUF433 family)
MFNDKNIEQFIVIDPVTLKPTIKDTKITVEMIIDRLAEGALIDEIMLEYNLNKEQISAVLRYAMRTGEKAFIYIRLARTINTNKQYTFKKFSLPYSLTH